MRDLSFTGRVKILGIRSTHNGPDSFHCGAFPWRIELTVPEANEDTAVFIEPNGSDVTASIANEVLSFALFEAGATAITPTPTGALLSGFATRSAAQVAIETISTAYPQLLSRIEISNEADHDWATSQRGGFTPTRVGVWNIRTPWARVPDDVDALHDLQIDPGAAFGHGAHPTTRLALAMMTPHLVPGIEVVDVGTGTGVLAIAAARAGATVHAVDNSDAALASAEANIAHNSIEASSTEHHGNVATNITLTKGDATDLNPKPHSLVVANVTIDVQREIAPPFRDVRHIICSGLLCRHVREIQNLYPLHSAKRIGCIGEWAAVELRLDPDVRPRNS